LISVDVKPKEETMNITDIQKKLLELRLDLRDTLKETGPVDYYRLREMIVEIEEMIADFVSEKPLWQKPVPDSSVSETPTFDVSKLFDMSTSIPNMCVVVAPTGEAIDIRIADGQLKISINTNIPDTPVTKTEEWRENKFCQPENKIFYQRISIPASTRNGLIL
jgi:hypothetical protein